MRYLRYQTSYHPHQRLRGFKRCDSPAQRPTTPKIQALISRAEAYPAYRYNSTWSYFAEKITKKRIFFIIAPFITLLGLHLALSLPSLGGLPAPANSSERQENTPAAVTAAAAPAIIGSPSTEVTEEAAPQTTLTASQTKWNGRPMYERLTYGRLTNAPTLPAVVANKLAGTHPAPPNATSNTNLLPLQAFNPLTLLKKASAAIAIGKQSTFTAVSVEALGDSSGNNGNLSVTANVKNDFVPPIVEYLPKDHSISRRLVPSYYETYLAIKERSPNLLVNDDPYIYDSEANEKIAINEIGDLVDEEGRDISLAAEFSENFPTAASPTPPSQPFKPRAHIIKQGESLWSIARTYQISIDSLITLNDIDNVHSLQLGSRLKIPPSKGVYHRVESGDTLSSLRKLYNVPAEDILTEKPNNPYLLAGETVFIKNARIPSFERQRLFGNLFLLPLPGIVTSTYGLRLHPIKNKMLFHTGIDIAHNYGTPIKAALAGTVVKISAQGNYGKRIVLRHKFGYETAYSHLSRFSVKLGTKVKRGSVIGHVGNTGLSTGPHLHFEIKHNKRFVNPARFFTKLKLPSKPPRRHTHLAT